MAIAIEIHDMSVGWAARRLMPELDLRLVHGETLAIVGPGGSGKSTTLRVIEEVVRGRSPSGDEAPWWRGTAASGVADCLRMRQHGDRHGETIRELLSARGLARREDWMPRGESERSLLHAVFELSLADAPETLRRFVSFALVAYAPSPLLLFDEPCFGLRGAWLDTVRARLLALAERGQTMVLVTHHLPLARALADHVMLIVDGQIIESARTADFFERAQHPRTRQFLRWGA